MSRSVQAIVLVCSLFIDASHILHDHRYDVDRTILISSNITYLDSSQDELNSIHRGLATETEEKLQRKFDWRFYLNYNSDVADAGFKDEASATHHYVNWGHKEGRWGNPREKPTWFRCVRYKKAIQLDQDPTFKKYCASVKPYPHSYNDSAVTDDSGTILLNDPNKPSISLKPTLAIFLQLGQYSDTIWNVLLQCIKNVCEARRFHRDPNMLQQQWQWSTDANRNTTVSDNFNLDIHISFVSEIISYRHRIVKTLEGLHGFDHIFTTQVVNLGLDVKPFLEQIANSTKNYDLVMKLHSKSDKVWLKHTTECLCGTPSQVLSIINEFQIKNSISMIAPHGFTFGPSTHKSKLHPYLVDKYFLKYAVAIAFDNEMIRKMNIMYRFLFQEQLDKKYFRIVAGTMFWVKFDSLKQLRVKDILRHFAVTFASQYKSNGGIEHVMERLLPSIIVKQSGLITEMIPAPKLLPFVFPQYHAIPENDIFWGKGFTEWTLLQPFQCVNPVCEIQKPLPVSEGGLGYYDLTERETRHRQGMLARSAGIYGFVYYHFWFSGKHSPPGHKVMHKVPELRIKDGEPDVPFMLSWANEPWSKRWSGEDNDILLSQEYGDSTEWREHFEYLLPFFQHHKYIKLDNKPVLIVYRIAHGKLVELFEPMAKLWNQLAIQHGFDGLYIMVTLGSFYHSDPETSSMIASIEEISGTFHFHPAVNSIADNKKILASVQDLLAVPSNAQYWGTYTGFNNRPRKSKGYYELPVDPAELERNLRRSFSVMPVAKWKTVTENFYFITAWNEWNEQAVLEPSDLKKFAYLEVFQRCLLTLSSRIVP